MGGLPNSKAVLCKWWNSNKPCTSKICDRSHSMEEWGEFMDGEGK